MDNKGPVLISYLSQIILIILLLQVSGFLRGLTILILLGTELLIISAISKEEKWNFQDWYALAMFFLMMGFIWLNLSKNGTSIVYVGMVFALIIGFFLTVFQREEEMKSKSAVKVVSMKTEAKKTETKASASRTKSKKTTRKAPAKKAPAKRKAPARKKTETKASASRTKSKKTTRKAPAKKRTTSRKK